MDESIAMRNDTLPPSDDALCGELTRLLAQCRCNLRALQRSEDIEERLLCDDSCSYVRYWAGGAYACALALQSLAPPHTTQPSPLLQGAIDRGFGSQEGLYRALENAAAGPMGFVWLSSDREGALQVNRTFSYATPLPLTPLLALPSNAFAAADIGEHLHFSNASRRYAALLAQRTPHLFT